MEVKATLQERPLPHGLAPDYVAFGPLSVPGVAARFQGWTSPVELCELVENLHPPSTCRRSGSCFDHGTGVAFPAGKNLPVCQTQRRPGRIRSSPWSRPQGEDRVSVLPQWRLRPARVGHPSHR